MQYRVGDRVYPNCGSDIEKLVEDKVDPRNLVGIVVEVKYGDASVEWLTADRQDSAEVRLRKAWWEEGELTFDYFLFLEKVEDERIYGGYEDD